MKVIRAMARQYRISLREEFDEHDTPDKKRIVLLDDEFLEWKFVI